MLPAAPLIGVTTSELRAAVLTRPLREGDPPQIEMALGMVYMRAVELAGGLPVVLPPLAPERVAPLVAQLAGVCLSGGPDLAPAGYGAEPHAELGPTEPGLDEFEVAIVREADRLGLPMLGICRGLQALNVARGGTLHQHLPDVTDGSIDHRQTDPGHVATHDVRIAPGSRLAGILGATETRVNSFHHQAIERLGDGLDRAWPGRPTARSRRSRARASGSCSASSGTRRGSSGAPSTWRCSRRSSTRRAAPAPLQAA